MSHAKDAEIWIEDPKIIGVGRGNLLSRSSSADDDMGVHHVCGAARREQAADARRVNPAEGDDIGGRLADKAGETNLAGRRPDNLSERRRRDRDAGSGLSSPGQQDKDPAVVAFEGDEGTGVQGHARHQAAVLAGDV
jgi:hypothetical protein